MTSMAPNPVASPEDLVGRLVESAAASMDLMAVYLGEQLGLYAALAAQGPATSTQLGERTGIHERYAREWLEQQATSGILQVDDPSREAGERVYALPAGYDAVLVDRQSELFISPLGRFLVAIAAQGPALLDAYRTGGGVSWSQFGDDARTAQADFNRPFFQHSLVPGYISQVPGVDAALKGIGARVAEIGPGGGWASIAIAKAYPEATVDGYDIDGPSVALANENAVGAGVSDRVRFLQKDAGDPAIAGTYDLVCAFECVHDMSDPVSALRTMARIARPGGTVIVMDERVADEFGAFGDLIERLFYGFSISCCLPDGMSHASAEGPSVGTGTVMRPSTLRRYALEAGFRDVEILPLEHDMFRFYRLVK